MLASDIITDVQNHGFTDISSSDILVHLNDTYQDLCSLESWPFLQQVLSTAFTPSQAAQFGTDEGSLLDIKQVLSLVNVTQGYELQPIKPDSFAKNYVGVLNQTGFPVFYYTPEYNIAAPNGIKINVWPIPTTAATVQLRYLFIPPDLATNSTPVFPARFHRVLTWGTLLSIYRMEDDTDTGREFQMMYDRHISRMREDLWSVQYDRDDTIQDITRDDLAYGW